MDITIEKKEAKPLLKLTEVVARISFEGATPTKKDVAAALGATLKVKQDLLIVHQVESKYGQQVVTVNAHVYDSKDALTLLERESMIKKNDFTAKPKEEKPAAAPAEAPAADKPTEAPQEKPKEEPPKEKKPEEKKEEPKAEEKPKEDAPKEEAKPKEKKDDADKPKEGDA